MIKLDKFFELKQNKLNSYQALMNSQELLDSTVVDYYNSTNNTGYQRPLYKSHYMKIANYLLYDSDGVLPTGIILAIKKNDVEVINGVLNIYGKMRIVDGQHRIGALRHILDSNETAFLDKIQKMQFAVNILIIDKEIDQEYITEIKTFININKKGKKVSTDLAYSLLGKITQNNIMEGRVDNAEIIQLISIKITKMLSNSDSCWYNSVKTGDSQDYGKPISQNAFITSIRGIVEDYFISIYDNEENIDNIIKKSVEDIGEILIGVWKIITLKWKECFTYQNNKYIYNKKYNIQKGIGVFPFHLILRSTFDPENSAEYNIREFERVIEKMDIKSDSWEKGGEFSIYNSQSGFREVEKLLMNAVTNRE